MKKIPDLNENQQKLLLTLTIIIIIAIFSKNIMNTLFGKSKREEEEERKKREEEKLLKNEEENLKKKGLKPSFSTSVYSDRAKSIHDMLKDTSLNDEPTKVEKILTDTIKNDLDFILLHQAYGSRTLYNFWIPVATLPLGATIRREFSNERIARVNSLLKQRKVSYAF